MKEYEETISKQTKRIKFEQKESQKYRQQIDALHDELKKMNQGNESIKNFISEITKILQIDLSSAQNLSWKNIIDQISAQKMQCDSLETVISKVEHSHNSDIDVYKEQIMHSQQVIIRQNEEMKALKIKQKEQTKHIESLTNKLTEISTEKEIHKKHKKELQELHLMLV